MGYQEFMFQEEVDVFFKGVMGEIDVVDEQCDILGVCFYNIVMQE